MSLQFRVFLLAVLAASVSYARPPPPDAYRNGVSAFRQGNYLQAAALAQRAMAAEPGSLHSRLLLAQSYHAVFEAVGLYYAEAVHAYESLVSRLSQGVEDWAPVQTARVLLGQLYLRGGDYDNGLDHLTRFLELQPDYRDADSVWNSIGVAYYYKNKYKKAVHAFESALEANPEFEPARFNLRSVFTRLGMFDQAMVNLRSGDKALALRDLESLLVMAPHYIPAVLQKAHLLYDLGRREEARKVASTTLALRPDKQAAFELELLLGDIAADRGAVETAIDHYRKCLRIQPGFMQVVERIDALEKASQSTADGEGAASVQSQAPTPPRVTTDVNQFPM